MYELVISELVKVEMVFQSLILPFRTNLNLCMCCWHSNFILQVKSVFLVVEPRSRISRGFAFVNMDSSDDANRCIKHLNQSVLEGRYITVERVSYLSDRSWCLMIFDCKSICLT